MSTDAIVLLKADHQQIREQFRRFTAAGENATAAKGRIVDKIIELLTVRTYIENEVIYPEVRGLAPGPSGRRAGILRGAPRRGRAGRRTRRDDTRRGTVRRQDHRAHRERHHHMDEKEQDWFRKVRAGLGRTQLQDLGARMMELKKTRPDQPGATQRSEEGHRRGHHLTTIGPLPGDRPEPFSIDLSVPEHLSPCPP